MIMWLAVRLAGLLLFLLGSPLDNPYDHADTEPQEMENSCGGCPKGK